MCQGGDLSHYQSWRSALAAGDTDALAALLHEDFSAAGIVASRGEALARLSRVVSGEQDIVLQQCLHEDAQTVVVQAVVGLSDGSRRSGLVVIRLHDGQAISLEVPVQMPEPPEPSVPPSEPVRPIFLLGPPRSGTTLLFEALSQSPDVHTLGGESHGLFEGISGLHPSESDWSSNMLSSDQASAGVRADLVRRLHRRVRSREGRPPSGPYCWLEKTPKNILRLPFLDALFPGSRLVIVYRDPRQTISSMIDGWGSGRFVTYGQLPGWSGPPWSFLLSPGWRSLAGQPPAQVAVSQWASSVTWLLDAPEGIDVGRCTVVRYGPLCADPQGTLSAACASLGIGWDRSISTLPLSATPLQPPSPDKWRRNRAALEAGRSVWGPVAERLNRSLSILEGWL